MRKLTRLGPHYLNSEGQIVRIGPFESYEQSREYAHLTDSENFSARIACLLILASASLFGALLIHLLW